MSEKSVTVSEDHLTLTNRLMIEKKEAKEGKKGRGRGEKGKERGRGREKRQEGRKDGKGLLPALWRAGAGTRTD